MNWQLISFFGDSTVLLPSALATFIALLLSKQSRYFSLYWGGLFALTGLVVASSKLAFMGFGFGLPQYDFTGFSGHSALSSAFWPVFLWLLVRPAPSFARVMAAGLGFLLAGLIGYSRIVIHAHSLSEVVTGLLLGSTASLLFFTVCWKAASSSTQGLTKLSRLCLLLIPLCLLNTGVKAPTQSILGEIAVLIGNQGKVFTRADMHQLYKSNAMVCQHAC